MGKVAKPLTAIEVNRLKVPGLYAVGTVPGLYLNVSGTGGSRSWILRVKVGTKRRDIGLGPFPAVKLAQAHEKARLTREEIKQGVDPIERKKSLQSALIAKQAQEITFQKAAGDYMKAHREGWKNAKHAQQWENTLTEYAYPVIGKLNVRDVNLTHVLQVLEPIWTDKNETASRLRGRIESVLDWAKVRGHREGENPAKWRGNLDKLMPRPSKVAKVESHPAIPVSVAGAFMAAVRQHQSISARALEFLTLTAARSGEVRGATWAEIDMDAKVWTVPAVRMKAGREHRVPLSDEAVALLKQLPKLADSGGLLFPSPRGAAPLSDMTLIQTMRRMDFKDKVGRVTVPHGLRSTFRDWAGERTSFPPDVVEMALAHARGDKTEAAYYRSDLFDKRRKLMQSWAKFLNRVDAAGANVVPMLGAA